MLSLVSKHSDKFELTDNLAASTVGRFLLFLFNMHSVIKQERAGAITHTQRTLKGINSWLSGEQRSDYRSFCESVA